MTYKAIKPCRFDRIYAVGESVPVDVIDPDMVTKLICVGMLEETGEAEAAPVSDLGVQNAQESVQGNIDHVSVNGREEQQDDAQDAQDGTQVSKRGRKPNR